MRNGTDLRYMHQDSLGSSSVVTDASGTSVGSIKYFPYGSTRSSSGSLDTDKKFTGQRLDSTGLYYYGARYYDPSIGRFISPDIFVQFTANPQAFNRYSYCINNPLIYTDPTGYNWFTDACSNAAKAVGRVVVKTVSTVVDMGKAVVIEQNPVKAVSIGVAAIIPDGYTVGGGVNVNLGFGAGISFGGQIVLDGYGGIAVAWSGGGGVYFGGGASITGQLQVINASSVEDLRGWCNQSGGSLSYSIWNVGVEKVTASNYSGVNFQLGLGIGTPGELHSNEEYGGVRVLYQGTGYPATTQVVSAYYMTQTQITWVYNGNQWLMYDPNDLAGSDLTAQQANAVNAIINAS